MTEAEGRVLTHQLACQIHQDGATCTCGASGRGLSLDEEQVLVDEGYEMALRDVLVMFDRTEQAVGPHAQPDYWFGAKEVVRSLMKEKP